MKQINTEIIEYKLRDDETYSFESWAIQYLRNLVGEEEKIKSDSIDSFKFLSNEKI